jgi:tetratricopeptide (TPR) repeat protein/outer membrane protein OmpA-like peptidoglycan-associated protein
MRKIFAVFILVFLYSALFSQEISIRKADELFGNNDVEKALPIYKEKLAHDPQNPEYLLRVGYCLMSIPDKKDSSITYLQNAADIFKSKKQKISYAEAQFYLGTAYQKNYRFDDAQAIFEALLKENKNKKDFVKKVEHEISNCKSSRILTMDTMNISIKNINILNSPFDEYSPVLTSNESEIIFTSRRKGNSKSEKSNDGQYPENIYFSEKKGGTWTYPKNIGATLNSLTKNANCGMSFDGNTLFVYKDGDIFESVKKDSQWTQPVVTKLPVNTKYKESDICINETGDLAIFSSDRNGGFGGMDLYKTTKDANGKWSEPVNLGKTINTEFDENGVFIFHDGTLFFSSKGHNSLGGFDIFSSKPDANGNYQEPVNLGYPINTVEDDISFFMSLDKKRGYFSSKRRGGLGRSDIYFVDFADSSKKYLVVKGKINKNDQTTDGISAKFIDMKTGKVCDNALAQKNGSFLSVVKKGKDYFVTYSAPDCFFENTVQNAPKDTVKTRKTIAVILEKIDPNHVNKKYIDQFSKNTDQLNPENELYLKTLADFLKQNPTLTLDVSCGSGGQNDLDNKRVETVVKYLKDNGIAENRIYTNIYPADAKTNAAQYTVLDKETRLTVFNEKIKNSSLSDNDKPDSGNLLKGNYTIQIGAFSKKLEKHDPYFKKIGGKVKIFLSNDNLYRYTYGKYTYMTEAEKNVEILHKLGYKDAFIRDINWYKSEAE